MIINQIASGGGIDLSIGDILIPTGAPPGAGWLPCDGSYVKSTDYPTLCSSLEEVSWVTQPLPAGAFNSIAYYNGQYAIAGTAGKVLTRNGLNGDWTCVDLGVTSDLYNLLRTNDGYWCINFGGTTKVAPSLSGTWTTLTSADVTAMYVNGNLFYQTSRKNSTDVMVYTMYSTSTPPYTSLVSSTGAALNSLLYFGGYYFLIYFFASSTGIRTYRKASLTSGSWTALSERATPFTQSGGISADSSATHAAINKGSYIYTTTSPTVSPSLTNSSAFPTSDATTRNHLTYRNGVWYACTVNGVYYTSDITTASAWQSLPFDSAMSGISKLFISPENDICVLAYRGSTYYFMTHNSSYTYHQLPIIANGDSEGFIRAI